MKLAVRLPPSPSGALWATVCVSALLAGCNGFSGDTLENGGSTSSSGGTGAGSSSGGSSGGIPTPTYTVGGTVTGLSSAATGFIIQNGTGNTLPIVSNGRFVFSNALAPGDPYQVTVQTQPGTPPQFCRVAEGTGVISDVNVTNVAIQCATTGKYLFAINPFDNTGTGTIAAFAIDPNTGALTAAAGSPYVPPETSPFDVAVDPSGQFIYVANVGSANISTDGIGMGGALTLDVSTASTGTATNQPSSVAIDPTGPYLFVGSDDNPVGTLEVYTLTGGVLTPAGGALAASTYPAGNIPYSLAVDPTNALLFGANLYESDLFDYSIGAGGALTAVAGSPFPFQQGGATNTPYAVALYPAGKFLYVTDATANSVSLYSYDNLGALTLIAVYSDGATIGLAPHGLAIDPTGSFLYVANSGSGSVSAFSINTSNGVLTPVAGSPFAASGTPSPDTPTSVRIDPSSQFAYVSNGDAGTISVFAINFATGALAAAGSPVRSILATGGTGGPSALAIE